VNATPRIALIHALAHSPAPINAALARDWPECRRMNILDDSLSADLAASPLGLDEAMMLRFLTLGDYAVDAGADAILFTCSAFGPCIEAVARRHADRPVLKPNEAMIGDATASGKRVGLVATFPPTLQSMPAEFPAGYPLDTELAEGALRALDRGDVDDHDRCIAAAALALSQRGCEVIALAQFSMARARSLVQTRCGCEVLTTVDSAVRELRRRLGAA
jgi:Asp/Glu/hydantoin racemase